MLPPSSANATEGNLPALFLKPNVPAPYFTNVLRQADAMKLVTCHVSGCGHKKGHIGDDFFNEMWECTLHSAISLSNRILETLNKASATAEVVDAQAHEVSSPEPPSCPTTKG